MDDRSFIETWLNSKSESTRISYRATVERFILFMDQPLKEIDLPDLQQWQQQLQGKFKPVTIANKTKIIKSLFKFGHEFGYFSSNSAHFLKIPFIKNSLSEKILDLAAVKRLIWETNCQRDRLLLSLIYLCGLRISETLNLTWNDLHSLGTGGTVTLFGKGGKTRIVNIPQPLWGELLYWQQENQSKSDYLFISCRGNKMSRQVVDIMIKRCCQRAKINPLASAHWLRHSHATHSLNSGCDLNLLKNSLGHASLATTEKYLHVTPDTSSSDFIRL